MRKVLAALLLLAQPALAQELDLAGSWQLAGDDHHDRHPSAIDIQPDHRDDGHPCPRCAGDARPFGPLEPSADGTWAMPVLDLSGQWSLNGTALTLTGGLDGTLGQVEVLDSGPVVVIDIALGGGQVQTVTFSRAP